MAANVGGRVVNKAPECQVGQVGPGLEKLHSFPWTGEKRKGTEIDIPCQTSNPITSSRRMKWEDVVPLQLEEWGRTPARSGGRHEFISSPSHPPQPDRERYPVHLAPEQNTSAPADAPAAVAPSGSIPAPPARLAEAMTSG